MKKYQYHIIPVNRDNYSYIITDGVKALVVDPGEAGDIREFLKREKLTLTGVLLTHMHQDHMGGVTELKNETPSLVVYSADTVTDDLIVWQGLEIQVLITPGHTLKDRCYYVESLNLVFTGDTLFTGGCGRMFEGDAQMFHTSLMRLKILPSSVRVLSGHEYLEYSIAFNKTLEIDTSWYESLRGQKYPSLETTIGREKEHNPFFLTEDDSFMTLLKTHKRGASLFKYLRGQKDRM